VGVSGEAPTGELELALVTSDGRLVTTIQSADGDQLTDALEDVSDDEFRARLYGEDDAGNLAEAQFDTLDATLDGTEVAQLTYLARTLDSQSLDEFRTRLYGEDDGGSLVASQAESLDTGVANTTIGQITYLARALSSLGTDEVRMDLQNSGIIQPTDQQDALEKANDNYGLDLTVAQSFTLQIDGYSQAEVKVVADSSTTVTVEYSWDDTHYYEYTSVDTTDYGDVFETGATYVRVSTTAAGAAGDTADIIISGKP